MGGRGGPKWLPNRLKIAPGRVLAAVRPLFGLLGRRRGHFGRCSAFVRPLFGLCSAFVRPLFGLCSAFWGVAGGHFLELLGHLFERPWKKANTLILLWFSIVLEGFGGCRGVQNGSKINPKIHQTIIKKSNNFCIEFGSHFQYNLGSFSTLPILDF